MEQHSALAALLREAGTAHGAYERDTLGGAYDEEWAAWYAAWLVAHDFGGLLGRAVTADETRDLLLACDREYKASGTAAPWAEEYAERLATSGT